MRELWPPYASRSQMSTPQMRSLRPARTQSAQTPMSAATNAGPNPGPSQRWQRGCPRDVTATSTTPTPPVPGDAQRWRGLYTGYVNKRTYTPARWPTGATLNPSSSQTDFQYSPAQARQKLRLRVTEAPEANCTRAPLCGPPCELPLRQPSPRLLLGWPQRPLY